GIIFTNENVSSSTLNANAVGLLSGSVDSAKGYTIVIKENYAIADGRFAHNGWLQELPHPVSKIVWDNYEAVSKITCKDLVLKNGGLVVIANGDRKLFVQVYMQAGSANNVITVETGYGQKHSGTVANNVGFNVNNLLSKSSNFSN